MTNSLGSGVSGEVYPYSDNAVVKRFYKDDFEDCYDISFVAEISCLQVLRGSDNIVQLIGFDPDKFEIYLDRYQTDLCSWSANKVIHPEQIRDIMRQVLTGLYHAYEYDIIHCDLKPQNILITEKNNRLDVAICDWGLARFCTRYNTRSNYIQTLQYRSPEILLDAKVYDTKIDIWSAGIIFWELLQSDYVFHASNKVKILSKIAEYFGTPTEHTWPGVTRLPNYCFIESTRFPQRVLDNTQVAMPIEDPLALDLLNRMLVLNPKSRIDVVGALNHPYFGDRITRPFLHINLIENLNGIYDIPELSSSLKTLRKDVIRTMLTYLVKDDLKDKSFFAALIMWERFVGKLNQSYLQGLEITDERWAIACLYLSEKLYMGKSMLFEGDEQLRFERIIISILDGDLYHPCEIDYLEIMTETYCLSLDEYETLLDRFHLKVDQDRVLLK